ncbi:forkhead box protein O-like [Dreissena polymorpha]|uniref:Forkhead box protein O n=1 Tax=Dreissena polymorpha TaxID=45954 RepID=A0A9D4CQC4_DREPO|nr:forkhead box protein O-like [Dreissena polymorpha]KAH3729679.1 hypothetical protein DPMN_055657 [Dreissena polymorpha]
MDAVEIDPNFEPQTRIRSHTWHGRPVEPELVADHQHGSPHSDEAGFGEHHKDILGIKQKTSSRRNAWGNLSYADLITKAIQSSPEQRLTLSQIYDWMVQNVPYFKDKGDNTSSAGWKNSIRHNLSLHSRFMRIQNEGTGKSSWWVINPDAKPGKAPRRRAGSMETKQLDKKRGRIKKKIEAIRAAQENGSMSSEDFQDLHYGFTLSPEFRTRVGSNASSCGRLSPIQAAVEPDLHESQVPPMSPIPWGQEVDDFHTNNSNEGYSLVDSLVGGLNIAEQANQQSLSDDGNDIDMVSNSTLKQQLLSGGSILRFNSQNNYDNQVYTNLPAPPPYNGSMKQQHQASVLGMDSIGSQSRGYSRSMSPSQMYQDSIMSPQRQMLPNRNMASPVSNNLLVNTQHSPARSPQQSPSYSPHSYHSQCQSPQPIKRSPQSVPNQVSMNQGGMSPAHQQQQHQQQQQPVNTSANRSLLQQCLEAPNDSMLRAALTQQMGSAYHPSQFAQFSTYNVNNNLMMPQTTMDQYAQQSPMNSLMMQQQNEGSGTNLELIDTNSMLDLDYDVEQLLRHELAMDSNLDFNFDATPSQNGATSENQNLVR